MLEHAAAIALLDPGLGKTSITLAVIDSLRKAKMPHRSLIIAPLRVCYQVWPAEIAGWADFQHLKIGILHGKGREQVLEDALDYDILVINPEGLEWLLTNGRGQFDPRRWKKLQLANLVIDELTRFKNSQGKRFKLLKIVLGTFLRRYGLTGTPAPNSLLDLFGQVYVIDEGRSFGRYITHYKREFFRPLDPNGWKWALQHGAEERIYAKLEPLAIRMAAADYLELPELVELNHIIDLPPKVRKLYEELEEDLIAKMEGGLIVAGNAAAASTKCRQICNGALYVDDDIASLIGGRKRTVLELHDLKIKAVEELVEDLQGNPLLLGYEFNHDLDRLLKAFPKTPYIGAGVSAKLAQQHENAWNRGEIPLMLAHPASAGHGLNLQKFSAHHVGWFGVPWNYELYDQFIKRILRQGNKSKRVFNHHFIARDSVDMIALYDKRRKEKGQNSLFEGLLAMREARTGKPRGKE